jgi:hypothetical protein
MDTNGLVRRPELANLSSTGRLAKDGRAVKYSAVWRMLYR